MKRASYRAGVRWIAWNDEPEELDPGVVAFFISSLLLADLFQVEPERVAADVVRERRKVAKADRRAARYWANAKRARRARERSAESDAGALFETIRGALGED